MEVPNVNNLNGVPNFGHGVEEVIPTSEEIASVDEVDMPTETEDTVKPYGKSKRTAK